MSGTKKARLASFGALVLALALASCSSTSDPLGSTSTTEATVTTTTTPYVPRYVHVDGHRVLLPTEQGHSPIGPDSGIGQNVIITASGFEPATLYSFSDEPIVFTNLTDVTQIVYFHDFPNLKRTKPIAPGAAWSFTYAASINVGYGNRSDSKFGQLRIGDCPPECG